ncbi:hypothetical protein [Roseovarius sp.]|uniref:hypothetical protein n=1 Tax=Roseovarius sp. TaxID=1486281 RepID=UPI003D0B482B
MRTARSVFVTRFGAGFEAAATWGVTLTTLGETADAVELGAGWVDGALRLTVFVVVVRFGVGAGFTAAVACCGTVMTSGCCAACGLAAGAADAVAVVVEGLNPQITFRPRVTRGTHVVCPSIPARMKTHPRLSTYCRPV